MKNRVLTSCKRFYFKSACFSFALFFLMGVANLAFAAPKPNEKEAKKIYESSFQSEIDSKFLKINKVIKTDGQEMNVLGVQIYVMDVEGELEFLEDTAVCRYAFSNDTKMIPAEQYNSMGYWQKYDFNTGCSVKMYDAGSKMKIIGTIDFEKKEKGWKNHGLKIANIEPLNAAGAGKKDSKSERAKHGDPEIGRQLFTGDKKFAIATFPCANCHKFVDYGTSWGMGGDLTKISANPSKENLLSAAYYNDQRNHGKSSMYSTYKITEEEASHLKAFLLGEEAKK